MQSTTSELTAPWNLIATILFSPCVSLDGIYCNYSLEGYIDDSFNKALTFS